MLFGWILDSISELLCLWSVCRLHRFIQNAVIGIVLLLRLAALVQPHAAAVNAEVQGPIIEVQQNLGRVSLPVLSRCQILASAEHSGCIWGRIYFKGTGDWASVPFRSSGEMKFNRYK